MINIGIYIFNDVEVLDFAGPFEVFSVTSELNDHQLFRVFTISSDGLSIEAVNGLSINPDYSLDDHPDIDILVIPGGVGTKKEMEKENVLNWIRKCYDKSQITFSVCSGARILGKLGFLDNKESITHHEVIPHLKEIAPSSIINPEKRFIDCGKIMTSGGISAGIDISLYIVEKLYGKTVKDKTIEYMEYGDWKNL